jgi:hypothetical protein
VGEVSEPGYSPDQRLQATDVWRFLSWKVLALRPPERFTRERRTHTMGGTLFDRLLREIFRHQRLMEDLQEENRELRRQLTAFREARGISLDICGKRFALTQQSTPAPAQVIVDPVPTSSSTPDPLVAVPAGSAAQHLPASQETRAELAKIPTHPLPATPRSASQPLEGEEEEASIRTFLEELMREAFAAGSTPSPSPTATWSPSATKQQSTDKDETGAFRPHLIGSFLLE